MIKPLNLGSENTLFFKLMYHNLGETRKVDELPWLYKIYNCESHSQEEAQPTNSEVSNAHKVVFTTKPTSGRKHKLLLPIKTVSIIVVPQCHIDDIIRLQICLYFPIQLSESWQSSSSHPNNKVLLVTQLLNKKTCLTRLAVVFLRKKPNFLKAVIQTTIDKREEEEKKTSPRKEEPSHKICHCSSNPTHACSQLIG